MAIMLVSLIQIANKDIKIDAPSDGNRSDIFYNLLKHLFRLVALGAW